MPIVSFHSVIRKFQQQRRRAAVVRSNLTDNIRHAGEQGHDCLHMSPGSFIRRHLLQFVAAGVRESISISMVYTCTRFQRVAKETLPWIAGRRLLW